MGLCAYNELFQDVCTNFMVIVSQVEEHAERLATAQNWWVKATTAQKMSDEGALERNTRLRELQGHGKGTRI